MKKELGGHHFARDDDVMNAVDHLLRDQNGASTQKGSACAMTAEYSVLM